MIRSGGYPRVNAGAAAAIGSEQGEMWESKSRKRRPALAGASTTFDAIVRQQANDDTGKEVQDLSRMAVARLLYERSQFDKAIEAFAKTRLGGFYFVNIGNKVDRPLLKLSKGRISVKFFSSTPSKLALKVGKHTITVKRPGFAEWERTVTVDAASSKSINAVMQEDRKQ